MTYLLDVVVGLQALLDAYKIHYQLSKLPLDSGALSYLKGLLSINTLVSYEGIEPELLCTSQNISDMALILLQRGIVYY